MYVIRKEDYLIKTRVSLADLLDAPDGECWVEIREPSTADFVRLQAVFEKNDLGANVAAFTEILPRYVIDHDFHDGDRKLDAAELVARLAERTDLFLRVIGAYSEEVLFFRGRKIAAK